MIEFQYVSTVELPFLFFCSRGSHSPRTRICGRLCGTAVCATTRTRSCQRPSLRPSCGQRPAKWSRFAYVLYISTMNCLYSPLKIWNVFAQGALDPQYILHCLGETQKDNVVPASMPGMSLLDRILVGFLQRSIDHFSPLRFRVCFAQEQGGLHPQ